MLDQVLVSRALSPITSLIAQLVATDRALLVEAEPPRSKCKRQQFDPRAESVLGEGATWWPFRLLPQQLTRDQPQVASE